MSKFRGSITLSIFSLSTLSNYHYWQSPKTRYWRLVRPYQTGIPPARLLALVWAHNSDLSNSFFVPSSCPLDKKHPSLSARSIPIFPQKTPRHFPYYTAKCHLSQLRIILNQEFTLFAENKKLIRIMHISELIKSVVPKNGKEKNSHRLFGVIFIKKPIENLSLM